MHTLRTNDLPHRSTAELERLEADRSLSDTEWRLVLAELARRSQSAKTVTPPTAHAPKRKISADDWKAWYLMAGLAIGGLTFLGCWIYAVATYGFFLGLGLGWIPSAVIGLVAGALSPLLVALLLILLTAAAVNHLIRNPDVALVIGALAGFVVLGVPLAWLLFDKVPRTWQRPSKPHH